MTRGRRWFVGLALLAVLVPARPAAADPARPGNVRSTVNSITDGAPVTAAVRGGDSFLEVSVERGHEAIVEDYEGYPYLRYEADGTVSVNVQSKARYQNETRSASEEGPGTLNPAGPPEWKKVASGGTYAWHDHRVHWMSPTRAQTTDWEVPLTVDGKAVVIAGRYEAVDPPSAAPWWIATLVVAVAVGWFARRRSLVAAVAVLVSAVVAVPPVVSLIRLPNSSLTLGALVVAGAVAAVVALAWRSSLAGAVAAGGGVAMALWGLRRTDVFGHAILVTGVPGWLDRLSVALALGAGLGAIGATVWAFTRPPVAPPAPVDAPSAA